MIFGAFFGGFADMDSFGELLFGGFLLADGFTSFGLVADESIAGDFLELIVRGKAIQFSHVSNVISIDNKF